MLKSAPWRMANPWQAVGGSGSRHLLHTCLLMASITSGLSAAGVICHT
ncbi:MAG: hypothetical protein L0229_25805 [Blastocatellia bacterium]|nr:hypothetical protein [Blastocatellia bacterium]